VGSRQPGGGLAFDDLGFGGSARDPDASSLLGGEGAGVELPDDLRPLIPPS